MLKKLHSFFGFDLLFEMIPIITFVTIFCGGGNDDGDDEVDGDDVAAALTIGL